MGFLQRLLLLYLLLINLAAFALYGADKRKAVKGRWRIPERTLLLFSFLGGSLGSLLAMALFHHKTRKKKFYLSVPLFLLLHVAVFGWLFFRLGARLL